MRQTYSHTHTRTVWRTHLNAESKNCWGLTVKGKFERSAARASNRITESPGPTTVGLASIGWISFGEKQELGFHFFFKISFVYMYLQGQV